MRIIDALGREVRAITVSADGRFLAAASDWDVAIWDWAGEERRRSRCPACTQLSFSPDGKWLAACFGGELLLWATDDLRPPTRLNCSWTGGVAFAPNGKHLVAGRNGGTASGLGHLSRWLVAGWEAAVGFDYWPAFTQLAYSPDGEYIAGIGPVLCQLRFARSGGQQGQVRTRTPSLRSFLTFAPDSRTLVCGWDTELHVVDTGNGRELRREIRSTSAPFRDAAFTGTGRHLGTVDDSGVLQLWDAAAWEIDRAYDWKMGSLTCLTFTADGLAGVCGTSHGQLIIFDLD